MPIETEKPPVNMPKVPIEQLSDPSRMSSHVNSKANTPRSMLAASQSYKERREQYKSDTKKEQVAKD